MNRRLAFVLLSIALIAGILLSPLSGQAAATSPGTSDLLAYWPLNETSGTREDVHGTRDLTDRNTVSYAAGIVNNAADFESGNYELLDTTDEFGSSTDGSFSASFWIRPESLGTEATFGSIMLSSYRTGIQSGDWAISLTSEGRIRLLRITTTSPAASVRWLTDSSVISTSTWYHVLIAYNTSGSSAACWINGASVTFTPSSLETAEGWSTSVIDVGGYSTSTSTYNYDGYLDELAVWGKALNGDNAEWLYNSGSGRSYSDLVGATEIGRAHV